MKALARILDVVGIRPRASVTIDGATDLQNPALWLSDMALGRKTASGEPVTEATALGLSAYFACLRNGAEDVAKLPRQVRRHRAEKRGSDLLTDHPLARVMKRPNPVMPWGAFAQVMQHRRMGWGNAYAEIVRDAMGSPVELWPVHSGRVRPELGKDGRTLVYRVRGEGGREKPIDPRDVFHLRGMGSGIEGYSVVRFASETLGLGLAAQRHAAAFFGEGLAKRLVAFTKQTLNADAREALRKRLEGDRERNPVGSRRMPIVDVEVDVKDLGIPPDEAQFLEQREFGVEEIARWFRMNLSKIQYFKHAQGWSSLDALNTEYTQDFLTPQVQAWEEEIEAKLLTEEERDAGMFVKFVFQGLMRGDVSTRIAYYSAGYDLSKSAEMEGVQVHVVSTGERKGAAAPGTPVTEGDLAEAQRLVDGFDAFFRAAVRDGRELGGKEASTIWTGAVWLAGEAKGLGLVDRVETLDATVERLAGPLRAKAAKARLAGR